MQKNEYCVERLKEIARCELDVAGMFYLTDCFVLSNAELRDFCPEKMRRANINMRADLFLPIVRSLGTKYLEITKILPNFSVEAG
uniref:Uncharacterized protein n=1 Tax=Rhizophagus irregularis (strain DAOM 181602 / DAOM 197198 / MUCL 43194) TaxID=747089 RepID=U9U2N2_RHIID